MIYPRHTAIDAGVGNVFCLSSLLGEHRQSFTSLSLLVFFYSLLIFTVNQSFSIQLATKSDNNNIIDYTGYAIKWKRLTTTNKKLRAKKELFSLISNVSVQFVNKCYFCCFCMCLVFPLSISFDSISYAFRGYPVYMLNICYLHLNENKKKLFSNDWPTIYTQLSTNHANAIDEKLVL